MDMSHPAHDAGHAMPMPGMLMPGMLTEAQMQALDQATGPGFDRLFLKDMIQHHRGAVTMVLKPIMGLEEFNAKKLR